jgi:hypothetical protein
MFDGFHKSVLNVNGLVVVVAACAGFWADVGDFTVAGCAVAASLSQ